MKSPLKFHGGKSYLAKKIVALFPPHKTYVEPYAGGLSVLLAKDPEGVSEIVNDLNFALTHFWRILQQEDSFKEFARIVQTIPFSEYEYENWDLAKIQGTMTPAEKAVSFFVRCRQSLAGRGKEFASLTKTRLRRGMQEQVSAWLTAVEGLPEVHNRLKRVLILNRPALEVIEEWDIPECVIYLDPPYPHSTRITKDDYELEMSDEQHEELLDSLTAIKYANFFISTYENEMYSDCAAANCWKKYIFKCKSSASHTKKKQDREEIIYTNAL